MGNMKKYSTTEVDYWKVLTVSVKNINSQEELHFSLSSFVVEEGCGS